MLLGQLKVDCIKKIKVDDNQALTHLTIEDYKKDRTYEKYFNNVINALNSGIRNLITSEKLPYQSHEIEISTSIKEIKKSDISSISIYRIKSILHESVNGNIVNVEFFEVAGTYKLGTTYYGGKLIILYAPSVRLLTDDDPDTLELDTLGLTSLVCGYLTYFVKAELYEKVEPSEAELSRKYANQYLAALDQEITLPTQKKVRQVISLD